MLPTDMVITIAKFLSVSDKNSFKNINKHHNNVISFNKMVFKRKEFNMITNNKRKKNRINSFSNYNYTTRIFKHTYIPIPINGTEIIYKNDNEIVWKQYDGFYDSLEELPIATKIFVI